MGSEKMVVGAAPEYETDQMATHIMRSGGVPLLENQAGLAVLIESL